jgi:hypothetical protein
MGTGTLLATYRDREASMIRRPTTGELRLSSRKVDPNTHERKNLEPFKARDAAERHERKVEYLDGTAETREVLRDERQ